MILKPVLLGHAAFEQNMGKKYKKQKPLFETMDRITWRGLTSDAIGNTYIPDGNKGSIEESMSHIRMKIQEKCHNTQELHHHIRRLKIGENKNITPNVFRATLLKFGVVLPQYVVDEVFQEFDKKRNGTMDFDDFCTWVMSAEFDPRNPSTKKTITHSASLTSQRSNPLKIKLQEYCSANPIKDNLKMNLSFLDFVSFVETKAISVTESDMRIAFVQIDKTNIGYISVKDLLIWAGIDVVQDSIRGEDVDVKTAIAKICGRKTILLERCFNHISKRQGIRIGFEEFKRCLISGGLGASSKDVLYLFRALGGQNESGSIDMDKLFDSLVPYAPDPALDKVEVATESHFRAPSASAADRRLREAIRKSFKTLRNALEAADRDVSGFIDPETLNAIINSLCMPISFQDFRLILRPVKTDDRGRVCWAHFLSLYNPRKEHLHLTAPFTGQTPAAGRTSTQPMGSLFMGGDRERGAAFPSTFSSSTSALPPASLHASSSIAESASAQQLTSIQTPPLLPHFNSRAKTAPSNASRPGSNAATTPAFYTYSPSKSGHRQPPPLANLSQALGRMDGLQIDIRKQWQGLLRECQRVDSERLGSIPRSTFIDILSSGLPSKTATATAMADLADRYRVHGRDVDYGACIRECLFDLMGTSPVVVRVGPSDRSVLQSRGGESGAAVTAQQQLQTAHKLVDEMKILHKYDPKLIAVCTKLVGANKVVWLQFKQSLRDAQFPNYRGCILQEAFSNILKHFNIPLSNTEKAMIFKNFRVAGVPDAVEFDGFLKLCSACKSNAGGSVTSSA